jgi:2-dehydropantoate 2-reductase
MKICIIGAGAMGCLFGGYLARAGHEVWLIARSADHIQALDRRGLILRHDGHCYEIPVYASHEPGDAGICDAIMIMTKATDTAAAMERALPAVGAATSIVTLQNGVGNVEKLARYVSSERILFGVTALGAMRPAAGEIDVTAFDGAKTFVWALAGRQTPQLERYVAALTDAGFNAVIAPDVKNRIWRKLCLNAGVSVPAAVIGLKAGALIVPESARELIRCLVQEICAVAAKEGVELDATAMCADVIDECRRYPGHAPSILVDVVSGRKTEVDCLNGAIVEIAARHGVATPYNHAIASILSAIEQSYAQRFVI